MKETFFGVLLTAALLALVGCLVVLTVKDESQKFEVVEKPVIKKVQVIEEEKPAKPVITASPNEISVVGYNNVLQWKKSVNSPEVQVLVKKALEDGKIVEREYEEIAEAVDVARYGNSKQELLKPESHLLKDKRL